jgi:predicted TIM-barrel fold metal-dependent hydrolase
MKPVITDFHTHAFPDAIAEKAMTRLQEGCSVQAVLDGRISSLLDSMDRANVGRSLICNIATKPSQFEAIMNWSRQIRSERIIPLPSIHPDDPDALEHISQVKAEGFPGIKLHPYYQEFSLDEDRIKPIYERLCSEDLLVLCHTGFDIAFEYYRIADPARIAAVKEQYPRLKFITSHLGAWDDWQEVEKHLIGRQIYIEISLSLEFMSDADFKRLLETHPADYILFGTDSPWADQAAAIRRLGKIGFSDELMDKMLRTNSARLLGD